MPAPHSVSQWIAHLKEGKAEAARQLWERYSSRLLELAKRRLGDMPKRLADEEDVAASVFLSVCRGAAAGRFQNVENRDDLWWTLIAITNRKVVDHLRRETAQKRGGKLNQLEPPTDGERAAVDLENLAGNEPTPEFVVMLQEQYERLIGLLRDDTLKKIAVARVEGYTVPEIARELNLNVRSVERKLALIRGTWAQEL
jgi:RNA polymerase sigma factor (sigma-70 family)